MAFSPRRVSQPEEFVSPKQREALALRKDELIKEMNDRLDTLPDSLEKQELVRKRDHALSKFPVFPLDLSIWMIAYYEEWIKAYIALSK
jgi:hypothetical protein